MCANMHAPTSGMHVNHQGKKKFFFKCPSGSEACTVACKGSRRPEARDAMEQTSPVFVNHRCHAGSQTHLLQEQRPLSQASSP